MIRRIAVAGLVAFLLCLSMFVVVHAGLGGWRWGDPLFRKYAAGMVLILSAAATTPVYGLLFRERG